MRVALYARVSTRDQTLDPQLDELRAYAGRCEASEVVEFTDHAISGKRGSRPGLDALLAACHKREVDTVVVVKLDRLGRDLSHLLRVLGEFKALGVRFVSLEDGLDTSTPVGELFMQIRGAFAQYEAALIQERCEAGRQAARKRGTHLGRPRGVSEAQEARVRRLRAQGRSIRQIAGLLGLPRSTVHRVARLVVPQVGQQTTSGRRANPAT